jgi:hypothetical protein
VDRSGAVTELGSSLEIRRPGARFDILILNFERVQLFFDNFHKLRNFDPGKDRIVVLDCSRNRARERELTETFARSHGWQLGGPEIIFVSRENWGIDQGARVDYLSYLGRGSALPRFVWQFQEHFLDNTSDYSRWGSGELAGKIKQDTIPDGTDIDLDSCEGAFEDPRVSVVFANRDDVGVFLHPDGREWFFTDGANLGFRTSAALAAFDQSLLDSYRLVFDASYRWCLYIEFDFCRRLGAGAWFDVGRGRTWRDVAELRAAALAALRPMANIANPSFVPAFDRYEHRLRKIQRAPRAIRQALLATWFPCMGLTQREVVQRIRAVMITKQISPPKWLKYVW